MSLRATAGALYERLKTAPEDEIKAARGALTAYTPSDDGAAEIAQVDEAQRRGRLHGPAHAAEQPAHMFSPWL